MLQLNRLFNFLLMWLPGMIIALCLSACVNSERVFVAPNKVMLADQHPNTHFEQEVMIVRISQVLLVGQMSRDERANLHFERGVLYDSLGLWALARYDFTQALALQPKMVAIYNYLGLYLLLDEDYDGALEAFNAVLDIEPSYDYTYLNRGLDFYYTGRYGLAEKDFMAFYEADKTDPYRVLWLYLNEFNQNPSEAKQNLVRRAATLSNDYWGTQVVQYYLGNISLKQLLQKAEQFVDPSSPQYAEILTETYFYLAKQKLNADQKDEAIALFQLAVANRVYNFVEYRFALFELSKLKAQTIQAVVQVTPVQETE
ncbi:lipoprotein NlpI [Cricetibacter osteomyelitidis]|uniref:Lipoprotein NlpI n=1 Tax=Cricetibacter osteomyelitidis TaxID=1521931 RepID=A0A4R2T3I7_9PAST|nr:lipoprotein NlpI [Cricetibacter osteomyelitidis]TCP95806.1 lipoprotein NlpI [Cricetibacter osteomyelitidis]